MGRSEVGDRTKNDGWKHGGDDRLDEMKFNFNILNFYTGIIINFILKPIYMIGFLF